MPLTILSFFLKIRICDHTAFFLQYQFEKIYPLNVNLVYRSSRKFYRPNRQGLSMKKISKKQQKNYTLMICIIGMMALIYSITIIKLSTA